MGFVPVFQIEVNSAEPIVDIWTINTHPFTLYPLNLVKFTIYIIETKTVLESIKTIFKKITLSTQLFVVQSSIDKQRVVISHFKS